MGLGEAADPLGPEFCEQLADRGFYVIRFDNRDSGRSTKVDGARAERHAAHGRPAGERALPLDDMAADAVGLLDHLGIERAHVVGVSMGGMIAQQMAIEQPERVRSLASIMSTTGDRVVGTPKLRVWGVLMRRAPKRP